MEWIPLSPTLLSNQGPTSVYQHKCLCISEHNSEGDRYGIGSTLSDTTFQ